MPETLANLCGGSERLAQAWTMAAETESWPQPAHSVETEPS